MERRETPCICTVIEKGETMVKSKSCFAGRIAFEKLTDVYYKGDTYYTIRNLSLYECQGWCREEPECMAASFRCVYQFMSKTNVSCFFSALLQLCCQPSQRPRPGARNHLPVAEQDRGLEPGGQAPACRQPVLHDQNEHPIW